MAQAEYEKSREVVLEELRKLERSLKDGQKLSRHSMMVSGSPQAPVFDIVASEASGS